MMIFKLELYTKSGELFAGYTGIFQTMTQAINDAYKRFRYFNLKIQELPRPKKPTPFQPSKIL